MNRSKKLAILSHCILNQNAVVKGEYKDMNIFFPFIKNLFENNIGILQLPCPETECYGLKRWGHVKEQFNNVGYKNKSYLDLCNAILRHCYYCLWNLVL